MLATLKTYSSEDSNYFSFVLSYSEKAGSGATLTVSSRSETATVELTDDDLKALAQATTEAEFVAHRASL